MSHVSMTDYKINTVFQMKKICRKYRWGYLYHVVCLIRELSDMQYDIFKEGNELVQGGEV